MFTVICILLQNGIYSIEVLGQWNGEAVATLAANNFKAVMPIGASFVLIDNLGNVTKL